MEPSLSAPQLPTRLETERLIIRLYEPADAEALRDIIERNREDLLDSFPKTSTIWQSLDACRTYIDGRAELWRTRQAFWAGVWLRSSGEHIGQLQVKKIAWEVPSAELGYFTDAGHRRRGLAREAVQAAVDAFLGERTGGPERGLQAGGPPRQRVPLRPRPAARLGLLRENALAAKLAARPVSLLE